MEKMMNSLVNAILRLQTKFPESVDIFFVDNGDQGDLIDHIRNLYTESNLNIIFCGHFDNPGFGKAHNIGLYKSKKKYHLILNPDVEIDEFALLNGIEYFERSVKVSCLSPSVIDDTGNVSHLCKAYPDVMTLFIRGFCRGWLKDRFREKINNYELSNILGCEKDSEVSIVGGAFMLCNRKYLHECGGFDERYFLYFEDFALSMELAKFGKLVYLPIMKIKHYGGNAAGKGVRHVLYFIFSGIKFFNHYGWKVF